MVVVGLTGTADGHAAGGVGRAIEDANASDEVNDLWD
jgi:hypothetical protein